MDRQGHHVQKTVRHGANGALAIEIDTDENISNMQEVGSYVSEQL